MVLWFPPNNANGEQYLAQNIYPSCEKPHTYCTTNMRGPNFILVTHFTPKIKLITYLNKPLRFEGQFNTHLQQKVSGWYKQFIGVMKIKQTQSFDTRNFTKKDTQHMQLITAQSGTPIAVQCSSSRTSWLFHAPGCLRLAQFWLSVIRITSYCLCYG